MTTEIINILSKLNVDVNSTEIDGFNSLYQKLTETKLKLKTLEDKKLFERALKILISSADNKLFPNVLPENTFGVPSLIADTYTIILEDIETAERSLDLSGKTRISLKNNYQLGIKFEDEVTELDGCNDLFDIIKKTVKSGVILQHYCALWNYASNIQKSFKFSYVKIDDILSTFLKKPEDGYFRKSTRENFTKSVKKLQNMMIRGPISTNNGRSVEYINIPLLDFKLSTENKDGSVILHFIGTMLGGAEYNKRGRIFPQGIFKFDSRTEDARISFAFRIATRFDQMGQKTIVWTRQKCIRYAGLSASDLSNRRQASLFLTKTLNRLIELRCISSYEWNGSYTDDNSTISICSNFNLHIH